MTISIYGDPFVSGTTVVSSGFLNWLRTSLPTAIDTAGGTRTLTGALTLNSQNVSIGQLLASGVLRLTGVISPSSLSSDQDDWEPTGITTANFVRIGTSADVTLTGLSAGQSAGRLIVFANTSSSNTVTLSDGDAASTAANRFACPEDAPFVMPPAGLAVLLYDGTTANWRVFGENRIVVQNEPSSIAIGASQNNYEPAGIAFESQLRLAPSGAYSLTGLASQTAGRIITIRNVGTNTLTLTHDDASSTAGNRFYCPGSANVVIPVYGSSIVQYDGTLSRWFVIAKSL